ncbi:trypco2 family protein [Methylomonas sp. MED-D]|uniref:trypco2 family protein n=1 Tax=unclassified Methylomonas TaxID=2608980 RepID=UPI0028A3CFFD|nr:trypco2 family protein [Methylomonas sp. MV1]MDT4331335.1 trypco2 family protein [Methylomonas sp. MV1]
MEQIPLADMLIDLRAELDKAQREGDGKKLRFRVESIDLELQVTVTKSAEAGGGVKFWVVNADGKAKRDKGTVQKLHLKLNPVEVDADGNERPVLVADDSGIGR